MNTPIDKTKSVVIIALNFFKEVNRSEENDKTGQPGQEQQRYHHIFGF